MLLLLIFYVELLLVVLYNHTMCIFNVQSHTVLQKIYRKTLFTVIYVHVGHNLGYAVVVIPCRTSRLDSS